MCSLIAHVEDGKIVRVQGDPDHPYTAGFACGKVNRDADLVNSPERIKTPLRRTGPKGAGQFKSITWDEALDEIAAKWKAIIAESGPLSATIAFHFAVISSSASSQAIALNWPEPLAPMRLSGVAMRSGEFTRSASRFTFPQAKPAV